ncbi:MAG: OadG family protein [Clostridia bacterium]|nr:OadG family protein [Clostridia bacterium]
MNTLEMIKMFTDEQLASFGITDALLASLIGICVVLLELGLLAVCIVLIGKAINAFLNKGKETQETVVETKTDSLPEVPTIGDRKVKLINVDEKSAAMVMALVSHETDIPLDRLDFKSIKKVD